MVRKLTEVEKPVFSLEGRIPQSPVIFQVEFEHIPEPNNLTVEQLQQSPALHASVLEQHSAYYLHWIQQRSDALKDRRLTAMLNEMDAEIENARAAWEYAVAHGPNEGLAQAIDALMRYYERRGRFAEGDLLCRLLTTREGLATPTLAHAIALTWQGTFATQYGQLTDARDDLQSSLNILETLQADPAQIREARALSLW